jgi:hypothetical protein
MIKTKCVCRGFYAKFNKQIEEFINEYLAKYEVIDIIDEFTKDLSGTEAVCTANAIKYILRWKKKNGIQDVKKAIWYLQHMVDKEEERLREEHAEFDEERLENMENEDKQECEYIINLIKNYMNSQKVPTKPLKSMKEICEFIIAPKEEVDMNKIMNPPYDELYKMNNNQKETINNLLREKKEMQDSIDILTDDKKSLQDLVRQLREEKKQPTEEEIHSCDDCAFKDYGPYSSPCKECDLSSNPPSKWVAED